MSESEGSPTRWSTSQTSAAGARTRRTSPPSRRCPGCSGASRDLGGPGRPPVDGDRLLERLRTLAAVGATPGRGVTRLAYSAEDVAARDLVAGWVREAGLAAGALAGARGAH